MSRSRAWVAAVAVGGSAVGAGVALSQAPAGAGAPAATAETVAATGTGRSSTELRQELVATIKQANALEASIRDLRKQVLEQRAGGGATQVVVAGSTFTAGSPDLAGLQAEASQLQSRAAALAAEQSQLSGEQAQIASEAAQLTAQRSTLAAEAAKLTAEAQTLAAEQQALSSATTLPSTHTTTGASGQRGDD